MSIFLTLRNLLVSHMDKPFFEGLICCNSTREILSKPVNMRILWDVKLWLLGPFLVCAKGTVTMFIEAYNFYFGVPRKIHDVINVQLMFLYWPTYKKYRGMGMNLSLVPSVSWEHFFKRFYLFTFREGKEGGESSICERHINWLPLSYPQLGTWPATQACALTRNWTGDDLSVRRLVLNPLSHTSQCSGAFLHTLCC